MGKGLWLAFRVASIPLFLNALLVLLRLPYDQKVERYPLATSIPSGAGLGTSLAGIGAGGGANITQTCSCPSPARSTDAADDEEEAIVIRKVVNYTRVAMEIPGIGPTLSSTLSRLGSQLSFDSVRSCPKASLARNPQLHTALPVHMDCPSVFVVGARKAGTSSLYQYLSKHPHFVGINLDKGPNTGETYYFSAHYTKESWSWEKYIKLFRGTRGLMTGDASVGNLLNCEVPGRIWRSCGKQAKIVILLRDPVNRFVSNFLMRVKLGTRNLSNNSMLTTAVNIETDNFLQAAIQKEVIFSNIENSWDDFLCLFQPSRNMVFEGLYYVHVMNWLCQFPPENILILNSEELFANATAIFQQVLHFVGLETLPMDTANIITSTVYNRGSAARFYQKLTITDRRKLAHIYESSNRKLFQLLGWENIQWSL